MRYRLLRSVIAVGRYGISKLHITELPADAVVTVGSEPDASGFVDVDWEDRHYFLFLSDLKDRALKIDLDPAHATEHNFPSGAANDRRAAESGFDTK